MTVVHAHGLGAAAAFTTILLSHAAAFAASGPLYRSKLGSVFGAVLVCAPSMAGVIVGALDVGFVCRGLTYVRRNKHVQPTILVFFNV